MADFPPSIKGALDAVRNYRVALKSSKEAEELTNRLPGWSTNGYGDAARHAIASGLISRRISPEAALTLGWLRNTLHPSHILLGKPEEETSMDQHNERFGSIAAPYFRNDDEFIDSILSRLDRQAPRPADEGLRWFGQSKKQGGLVQMKECSCHG